jgi:hypothetical protein
MKFTPGRVTAQKLDKVTGEPVGEPVDITPNPDYL